MARLAKLRRGDKPVKDEQRQDKDVLNSLVELGANNSVKEVKQGIDYELNRHSEHLGQHLDRRIPMFGLAHR